MTSKGNLQMPNRTAEAVITTALIAAKKFQGNYSSALDFLASYEGFYRIDKGVFSKRLHRLEYFMSLIFSYLGETIKDLNLSKEYIIDTFPVSVCRNIRIPRCKLLQGEAYRGFNDSKREWFYGFKVQIITDSKGIPVQFDIFCGETGDVTAFQCSQINLPNGSSLFGDKAYNDYEQEDFLHECDKIHLKPIRKSNSKRPDKPYQAFYKNHVRKMVENSFAMITNLFPRHIHATSVKGFLLKIFIFVLAFTIL
jgi:Transposase DDE domain